MKKKGRGGGWGRGVRGATCHSGVWCDAFTRAISGAAQAPSVCTSSRKSTRVVAAAEPSRAVGENKVVISAANAQIGLRQTISRSH